jgi:hypothetical protein
LILFLARDVPRFAGSSLCPEDFPNPYRLSEGHLYKLTFSTA